MHPFYQQRELRAFCDQHGIVVQVRRTHAQTGRRTPRTGRSSSSSTARVASMVFWDKWQLRGRPSDLLAHLMLPWMYGWLAGWVGGWMGEQAYSSLGQHDSRLRQHPAVVEVARATGRTPAQVLLR